MLKGSFNLRVPRVAIPAAILAGGLLLTGFSCDKYTEPFKDSPRTSFTNNAPATVVEMPDGFSNAATKCLSPGIRITVVYHKNAGYAAVSTVQDPHCK